MQIPEPGIYLNFPEAEYHAVKALSKSTVKRCISPIDAWRAIYGEPEPPTDAMKYGSAFHAFMLEGEDVFRARYFKKFDESAHPDALRTAVQIKAELKARGLTQTGNKDEIAARLKFADPTVELMDDFKAAYDAENRGKVHLHSADFDEILSRKWIRAATQIDQLDFTEVSFFWDDADLGMPCKARLDAVQFRDGKVRIWDLKTFSNVNGTEIGACVALETGRRRYFVDASFYIRAFTKTPQVFHGGEGWGYPVPSDDEVEFWLLFVEKGHAHPNVIPRQIPIRNGNALTEIGAAADAQIHQAAQMVAEWTESHGERPWNRVHRAETITEAEIPVWMLA